MNLQKKRIRYINVYILPHASATGVYYANIYLIPLVIRGGYRMQYVRKIINNRLLPTRVLYVLQLKTALDTNTIL